MLRLNRAHGSKSHFGMVLPQTIPKCPIFPCARFTCNKIIPLIRSCTASQGSAMCAHNAQIINSLATFGWTIFYVCTKKPKYTMGYPNGRVLTVNLLD